MQGFRNGSLLIVKAKEEPRASSAAQYEKWIAAEDFYPVPFVGVSWGLLLRGASKSEGQSQLLCTSCC